MVKAFRGFGILSFILFLLIGYTKADMTVNSAALFHSIQAKAQANPGNADNILKMALQRLPEAQRIRLASGSFAAVVKGIFPKIERADCNVVTHLFQIAVTASPESAPALIRVAYEMCPSDLSVFLTIAIKALQSANLDNLIPALVATAVELDQSQRDALLQLALTLAPDSASDITNLVDASSLKRTRDTLRNSVNPVTNGGTLNTVSPAQ